MAVVAVDTYFSGVLIPKELSKMYETIFALACSPDVAALAYRMPRVRLVEGVETADPVAVPRTAIKGMFPTGCAECGCDCLCASICV